MINIRHQVRYWIKLNICKAGSWETVRTPHSPYGVVMKEVWREFIWQESLVCCETQCHSPIKRGARWLFLILKQVEGWWVYSVSLWSVSSYWVGNVCLIPEETQACFLLWWWERSSRGCSCPGHFLSAFVRVKTSWASLGPDAAAPGKGQSRKTIPKVNRLFVDAGDGHIRSRRAISRCAYDFCTCDCSMIINTAVRTSEEASSERSKVLLDSSGLQIECAKSWRRTQRECWVSGPQQQGRFQKNSWNFSERKSQLETLAGPREPKACSQQDHTSPPPCSPTLEESETWLAS